MKPEDIAEASRGEQIMNRTLEQEMEEDSAEARTAPEDKLEVVRAAVRAARDLRLEIADLSEQLKIKNTELSDLIYRKLPDVFSKNGVHTIGIDPEGNLPGYLAELRDYYHANIATTWDQERQDRAYDLLEETGRGDLIKRTISIRFGLKEQREFQKVYKILSKIKGLSMMVKRSVPWNSLTAMIKETYEGGEELGSEELYVLGATVGQSVNIKEEK